MRSLLAVLAAFCGVRRGRDAERDRQQLAPHHLIAAALAGALGLVVMLVIVVNWVAGA